MRNIFGGSFSGVQKGAGLPFPTTVSTNMQTILLYDLRNTFVPGNFGTPCRSSVSSLWTCLASNGWRFPGAVRSAHQASSHIQESIGSDALGRASHYYPYG